MLLHAGGAKGKGLLDAARKAGGARGRLPEDDQAGGPAGLRAAASSGRSGARPRPRRARRWSTRSAAICGSWRPPCRSSSPTSRGRSTRPWSAGYYTGRAEASSFTVADRAVEGRAAEALEALRWSLSTGVAPVPDHQCAGPGRAGHRQAVRPRAAVGPADLARELGMPPWKIDRVRQQMRGWTPDGVVRRAAGGRRGGRRGQGRRRRSRVRPGEGRRDHRPRRPFRRTRLATTGSPEPRRRPPLPQRDRLPLPPPVPPPLPRPSPGPSLRRPGLSLAPPRAP